MITYWPLLLSSQLFVIPMYFAYSLKLYQISFATTVVMITSILNYGSQQFIAFRAIDIATVFIIGIYYSFQSLIAYNKTKYFGYMGVIILTIIIFLLYIFYGIKYNNMQVIVHLISIVGILLLTWSIYYTTPMIKHERINLL